MGSGINRDDGEKRTELNSFGECTVGEKEKSNQREKR
jgi:hypothetical protein